MPTIPEVNVHVHVGDVASGSSQRVDGPADIAKEKSEKPTQPVSIDFPLSVFGKGVVDCFNLDGTNSFHGLKFGCCFCFPCCFFQHSNRDDTFTQNGFRD